MTRREQTSTGGGAQLIGNVSLPPLVDTAPLSRRPQSASGSSAGRGPAREFRCAACGYGIVVKGPPPRCPMCHESAWEHLPWRPFSGLLNEALGGKERTATATAEGGRP